MGGGGSGRPFREYQEASAASLNPFLTTRLPPYSLYHTALPSAISLHYLLPYHTILGGGGQNFFNKRSLSVLKNELN